MNTTALRTVALTGITAFFSFTYTFAQQGMGVGTNNPLEMLHVTGAIKVGTDINNSSAAPSGGAGTIRFKAGQFEGWDGTTWTPLGGGADTDWLTNGNHIYNGNTGNVGIGTTTPNAKLNVNGELRITDGNWFRMEIGTGLMSFRTVDAQNYVQWDVGGVGHAADAFYIGDVSAPSNEVYMLGNVGIGNDTPMEKLDVTGSIRMVDGSQSAGYIPVSDANGVMTWTDPTTIITAADGDADDTNELQTLSISGNSITLSNGGGTVSVPNDGDWTVSGNDLYNTNTGNVGVGTTTPDRLLNIESATGPQMLFTRNDNNTTDGEVMGELLFDNNDDTAPSSVDAAAVIRATASGPQGNSNKGGNLLFLTKNNQAGTANATERMRVAATGNVGIGTAAPAQKLHVAGSIQMVDGNQQAGYIPVSDANGKMTWTDPTTLSTAADDDWTVSGTDLYRNAGGNVGIRTASPLAPLHVKSTTLSIFGSSPASAYSLLLEGTSGRPGIAFHSNMANDATKTPGASIIYLPISYANGYGSLLFQTKRTHTNGSWAPLETAMEIDSEGHVGIGHSQGEAGENPLAALHVYRDASAADNAYIGNYQALFEGPRTVGSECGIALAAELGYELKTPGAAITYEVEGVYQGSYGKLHFKTRESPSTGMATALAKRMTIAQNGNVGIGATDPEQQLDVRGSIQMVDGNQQAGYIPVSDANGKMTWTDPGTINTNAQTLSLSGSTVTLSNGGGSITLADNDASNEIQTLSLSGSTVTLSNGGGSIALADNDASNEIQTLSLSGSTVTLSNGGGSITLADNDATNEIQTLSLSGSTVTLSNGGGSITLADNDATNEIQTLSYSGSTLSLSNGGNSVDLGWTKSGNNIYNSNSGRVGIGTSSPITPLDIRGDASGGYLFNGNFVMRVENNLTDATNGTQYNGIDIRAGKENNNGANSRYISFTRPGSAYIGGIVQNNANSVAYNTTSDERLKTNIQPSTYGISELMAINVVDYVYKDEMDDPQNGFIAQQLYEVYPFPVTPGGEDVTQDPWTMDYGKLTPLLVKAVQDLKAEKDELEALVQVLMQRIEQLEQQ